jgi:polysaccharide chain length determinant protein (PEP-CTERM system associated)
MQPQEYAAIFLRRKWMIIFSILFILFTASVYCVVVPEQFRSSTTILVIPQRVPEGYVRSTVSIRIEERLATIRQQVMSRTRLTTVMEELGLFKEERKKRPVEEVVESMRKRIDIQVRGNDAFTLSFVHENRQMAMLTTSRLASFFIDENLKVREQQAVGTSEFLDSQMQETKKKLELQEEKVKQYKMRFMGQLPQQMEANLSMLRGLQDRFRVVTDAKRSAEDRKVFLEAQASSLERSTQAVVATEGGGEQIIVGDPAHALATELAAKRAHLSDLSAKYTDKYPEIQRMRREVAQLETRIEEIRKSNALPDNANRRQVSPTHLVGTQVSPDIQELRRLRAQIVLAGQEIVSMKKEREEIQSGIAAVQAKVEQSPRREQEMIALTRDYDNIKHSYDELLRKKLDADVSQNLEKRQKGEQFQILDPANLPEEPFIPDRKKVFALAAIAALLLGFGGAMALEILDPTLRGVTEFRHFFEIPVLASIPILQDQEYTRKQAIRKAAIFGGIVTFTTVVSIFLLIYSDKIRTILSF